MDKPDDPRMAVMIPITMGAVVDFVMHLCERDQPLVVGKDYPNDKIIDEIKAWADNRDVNLTRGIDRPLWIQACESGTFK